MKQIKAKLLESVTLAKDKATYFFKTGAGEYAEGDEFIGVSVPNLRKIARNFPQLSLAEIEQLLYSRINEERLLALLILSMQYEKAELELKEIIYQFYLKHLHKVNNWNLVDALAHLIIGAHLNDGDRSLLLELAASESMWCRRIAIVATWNFIRKNDLEWTFKLATQLLNDKHDLIHKAVGWMLREAGKRDFSALREFLDQYAHLMPRTMLRYAIERLSPEERKKYMLQGR